MEGQEPGALVTCSYHTRLGLSIACFLLCETRKDICPVYTAESKGEFCRNKASDRESVTNF